MMLRPKFLSKGDWVGITCPAKKLPNSIDLAIKLLESWGLNVIVGETIRAEHYQFAGNDQQRAAEFQEFIDNKTIKAVFAARGGYGCVRIIDCLNFNALLTHPKWIVGFSDITVFHSHLHQNFQLETIHAQMPLNVPEASKKSLNLLKSALFGTLNGYTWKNKRHDNIPGETEGVLIGGNLAILTTLEGSVSAMDFKDKILFIEDVGEAHYALDRMLYQLLRAGKLAQLKGLVVGGFSHLRDRSVDFGQSIEQIVIDKVKAFQFPVAFQFSAGHIKNNNALYLGRKIILEVSESLSKITYI